MSSRSFDLLPAAEHEANDAFDWYESEQVGLGDRFRTELKLTLKRIISSPLQYAVVHGSDIRRAGIKRFPYSVIFRLENDSVLVLAIFHEKRNPIIWRGRID
ncbi:MAG: type II toxin-antitoxin system RelE/ParE family toxin [Pyrinomonadaceae bacterium]